jgi:adenylate kinase family enzyme
MLNKKEELHDRFQDGINRINKLKMSVDDLDLKKDTAEIINMLNEITRSIIHIEYDDESGQDRLEKFFRDNLGKIVTNTNLAIIFDGGTGGDWGRAKRRLVNEKGYKIESCFENPNLKPGEYLLETLEREEEHDRNIDDNVKSLCLKRDNYKCRCCNIHSSQLVRGNTQSRFEFHHINPAMLKGTNKPDNVVTLCNVCHKQIHKIINKYNKSELHKIDFHKELDSMFHSILNLVSYYSDEKNTIPEQGDLF